MKLKNSDNLKYREFYKRHLPHFQPENGFFFVTYRLAFSLPKYILEVIEKEKEEFKNQKAETNKNQYKIELLDFSKKIFYLEDKFIDKYKQAPMYLNINEITEMVIASLMYYHKVKYNLICFSVMPNHVHCIIKPLKKEKKEYYSISDIIGNHKKYTARKANKILNRYGDFWHEESYDHFIRSEEEFYKIIKYILYNPVKAGLVEDFTKWKYYWLNEEYLVL